MPELAKVIRVTRGALQIDGNEFPWFISAEGPSVNVARDSIPGVTVRIAAERVEVEDAWDAGKWKRDE